jgi:periplasmic divalent cation tolerance protein
VAFEDGTTEGEAEAEAEAGVAARLVLSTCADRAAGELLARALVSEGAAACVSLLPAVRSIYRWQGAIEETDECLLVIKTTRAAAPRLVDRLTALHGYEVPEVLALNVDGSSSPYLAWLAASVVPPES